VLLRFLIAGILLYTLWKRKHGDNIIYLGLLLVFLTCFLKQFPIERPQVFSFLFFAVLLYLLERIRETGSKSPSPLPSPLDGEGTFIVSSPSGGEGYNISTPAKGSMLSDLSPPLRGGDRGEGDSKGRSIYLFLPLLMLFWANMHPGFIIGHVTIILYIIMEGIKFLHPSFRPMERQNYKRLCLAAASGIVFSLVNPNIYRVWQQYLEYNMSAEHWNLSAGYISTLNPDYMSSIQYFLWSNDYSVILYWLLILLAIAALAFNRKKIDITELALLSATGFMSFITARYSFFFMAAALPVIARSFSRDRLLNFSRVALPAIAIFAGIFFSWGEQHNIDALRSGVKIDDYLCPVKAADFIIAHDIRGNMYNAYEWGGYLIWRLAPERKVFIDPRDLFEDIGREALFMINANRDEIAGIPVWKGIVRARSLEYVVIPIAWTTGAVVPLFNALMLDDNWLPVFCDINAVIFVKDSSVNEHVIRKYSIPKDYLMNALITLYDRLINTYPSEWKPSLYITKGDLYLSSGNVGKAREDYTKAVELAPFNITAIDRLNLVRKGD
jgi:hypothetical protein